MSITYRLANAPKGSAMYAFTCSLCGHEELNKPVFLDGGAGVAAYGTGCAAKLLGCSARRVRVDADNLASKAALDAEYAIERAGRYAFALAAFEAGDHGDATLVACRRNYHVAGGFEGLGINFPAFLAREATV
jgi:hypothetical protein